MNDTDLGIFFREGIANILLAIDEANLDMVSRLDAPEVRIYRAGFAAAIHAVSLAFGLAPRAIGLRDVETIGEPTQLSVPQKFIERR